MLPIHLIQLISQLTTEEKLRFCCMTDSVNWRQAVYVDVQPTGTKGMPICLPIQKYLTIYFSFRGTSGGALFVQI